MIERTRNMDNDILLTLANTKSFYQVRDMFGTGQISEKTFERFCKLWTWSAFRFSEPFNSRQWGFRQRHGIGRLYARFDRVKRLLAC